MSTSLLTRGATSKLVGNPMTNPIAHPLRNLCTKPEAQPVIMVVIAKVIVESIASVMKIALSNVAYLLINAANLSEE
jgi:hypothetical protein